MEFKASRSELKRWPSNSGDTCRSIQVSMLNGVWIRYVGPLSEFLAMTIRL